MTALRAWKSYRTFPRELKIIHQVFLNPAVTFNIGTYWIISGLRSVYFFHILNFQTNSVIFKELIFCVVSIFGLITQIFTAYSNIS